jgi:hypothetical protein
MLANTRRIFITLLPCAAILLLLALAWPEPALAQQTFSVDFPKKAGEPNSCMTQEKAGSGGTYLHCRIVLPSGIPANMFIRAVFFSCQPGSGAACQATRECPGNGAICDRHPNPVEPVGFNLLQPGVRTVDWWGWTSDPGDATLHFDVTIGP